jgi:hypothetical protein
VSHDWKRAVNYSITDLDLSEKLWTPWEKRAELMASKDLAYVCDGNGCYANNISYPCIAEDVQGERQWLIVDNSRCKLDQAHVYKNAGWIVQKIFGPMAYHKGSLFLWEHGKSRPLLCEVSGEALWKVDEVIFSDFKQRNPFKVYFSNMMVDLTEFPCLQKLNLKKNSAITDELLAKATGLSYLNLEWNDVITHQSVAKLSNLEILDIRWAPQVRISALSQLSKLRILKFDEGQDMGNFFSLPKIEELHCLRDWEEGDDFYSKQVMMYIVEALFTLIDKNEGQSKHKDLLALKKAYESRILLPNDRGLNTTKRKTTYSFDAANVEEDTEYMAQLTEIKARHVAAVENEDEEVEPYWENPWEISTEIYKTVIRLLQIAEKNIKIYVSIPEGDNDILTLLDDVAQKEKV